MVGCCSTHQHGRQHPVGVTQVWRTACAFPKYKESYMGIFTIIGVIVVVLFIVGYLGLR